MPSTSQQLFGQQSSDAQSLITGLTRQTLDLGRRLAELNLRLAQHMLQDSTSATRQVLSATDPWQAIAASVNATQPALDHLRAYHEDLAGLFSGTRMSPGQRTDDIPAQAGPAAAMARADGAAGAHGYSRHH